jgi:hypothetical protein
MQHEAVRQRAHKKRRTVKPGNLTTLKRHLWKALLIALDVAQEYQEDPNLQLRAAHCISQVAGQYAKLHETSELEKRIKDLENALQPMKGNTHAHQNFTRPA